MLTTYSNIKPSDYRVEAGGGRELETIKKYGFCVITNSNGDFNPEIKIPEIFKVKLIDKPNDLSPEDDPIIIKSDKSYHTIEQIVPAHTDGILGSGDLKRPDNIEGLSAIIVFQKPSRALIGGTTAIASNYEVLDALAKQDPLAFYALMNEKVAVFKAIVTGIEKIGPVIKKIDWGKKEKSSLILQYRRDDLVYVSANETNLKEDAERGLNFIGRYIEDNDKIKPAFVEIEKNEYLVVCNLTQTHSRAQSIETINNKSLVRDIKRYSFGIENILTYPHKELIGIKGREGSVLEFISSAPESSLDFLRENNPQINNATFVALKQNLLSCNR